MGVGRVVPVRVEPAEAQAGRVRHARDRVQDDAGMSGRLLRRIHAVDRFVGPVHIFALIPQPLGNVFAATRGRTGVGRFLYPESAS